MDISLLFFPLCFKKIDKHKERGLVTIERFLDCAESAKCH